MAAVAGADVVGIRLDLHKVALGLEIRNDRLPAGVAVHAMILAAVFVDGAVVVEDADDLQIVPQADFKVVGVMRRGHFDRAGAEADLAVFIAHDGDLPIHNGQDAGLADQVLELFILGVDSHAGITHHGFRTGRGDDDIAAAVGQRVADIPEMAGLVGVFDLRVGQRSHAVRTPVDDAAALIDEALVVKLAERLTDGLGAALVHREARARPVAADAHLLLLLHDAVSVLLLPRPDALEELLAAKIVAGQIFFGAQPLLDLDLRGDARVIDAGDPEGTVALHPLVAGQDILEGGVHRMAHMELSGDVGGRHDDGIRLFVGVGVCVEAVVLHPHLIDGVLDELGIILLG